MNQSLDLAPLEVDCCVGCAWESVLRAVHAGSADRKGAVARAASYVEALLNGGVGGGGALWSKLRRFSDRLDSEDHGIRQLDTELRAAAETRNAILHDARSYTVSESSDAVCTFWATFDYISAVLVDADRAGEHGPGLDCNLDRNRLFLLPPDGCKSLCSRTSSGKFDTHLPLSRAFLLHELPAQISKGRSPANRVSWLSGRGMCEDLLFDRRLRLAQIRSRQGPPRLSSYHPIVLDEQVRADATFLLRLRSRSDD